MRVLVTLMLLAVSQVGGVSRALANYNEYIPGNVCDAPNGHGAGAYPFTGGFYVNASFGNDPVCPLSTTNSPVAPRDATTIRGVYCSFTIAYDPGDIQSAFYVCAVNPATGNATCGTGFPSYSFSPGPGTWTVAGDSSNMPQGAQATWSLYLYSALGAYWFTTNGLLTVFPN